MGLIDVRSDTVSLPTAEMFEAMRNAELGDDILGEDPTVQELEELGAAMFGKEAALFVVSGTMANQIAVMVYTERGQEVIVGKETHIYNLEVAALAALSQVQPRPVSCPGGYFDPQEVENAVQKPGIQSATTGLICLENTYNLNRGLVMSIDNIKEISVIGAKYGIPVYMDGARVLNAAVALKKDVKEIVEPVDAVQLCLTKGLAAPVGSLLMGPRDFIDEARRIRQRLGGGMRQAGVIAAAGIVALEKMVDRLAEDHENAQVLAKGLQKIDERLLNIAEVQTNIIAIDAEPLGINGNAFLAGILEKNIKIKKIGSAAFRMICHHNISREDIKQIIAAVNETIKVMR